MEGTLTGTDAQCSVLFESKGWDTRDHNLNECQGELVRNIAKRIVPRNIPWVQVTTLFRSGKTIGLSYRILNTFAVCLTGDSEYLKFETYRIR